MMTVSTIFFAPQGEDGTSMMSLNRYVLATPFFMIFFFYYFEEWRWTRLTIICASAILAIYPLLIGLYQTLEGKVFFASSTFDGFKSYLIILAIILLYASLKFSKYWLWKFSILFLAQIAAQIFLYNRFLNGHWVG